MLARTRELYSRNKTNLNILGVLALLAGAAVVISAFSGLATENRAFNWLSDLLQNFGTEMLGAGVTFGLIEWFLEGRRKKRESELADEKEKERLILQMGSPDNAFAVEAVRQLQYRGWLQDGSLRGANLRRANLEGAILTGANLEDTTMWHTNLQRTYLVGANLQGAMLQGADLRGADLRETNLQGVVFANPGLGGLPPAKFDEKTTLPDGTRYDLSDPAKLMMEQLERFINPPDDTGGAD